MRSVRLIMRLCLLTILVVLPSACARIGPRGSESATATSVQGTVVETLLVDGVARSYVAAQSFGVTVKEQMRMKPRG